MSSARMHELFQDDEFKSKLLRLREEGLLVEGSPCPSGCGGNLKTKTISYVNHDVEPWDLSFIDVLACKCGFQVRVEDDASE